MIDRCESPDRLGHFGHQFLRKPVWTLLTTAPICCVSLNSRLLTFAIALLGWGTYGLTEDFGPMDFFIVCFGLGGPDLIFPSSAVFRALA